MMMMSAMSKGGGKGGRQRPRHNGKACIEFSSAAEAKKAIKDLNGKELDGRALELDTWSDKEGGRVQGGDASCKVYVKNMAWKTRGWKLKEHFAQAGTVVNYKQMNERTKKKW